MDFGKKVKYKRVELGYTQKELGKRIGVGRTTISEYESGNIVPKQENLIKLANVLNVSVDYLTGQSESQHTISEDSLSKELIVNEWIGALITTLKNGIYTPVLYNDQLDDEKTQLVINQLQHLMDNLRLIHKIK